ncbi:MAG: hypothetical protein IAI50_10975 [Candidatus Eremiobacteraeota bacterium]|nr:hypothetical protein [Candidatus Eremiobacteraeota bacterium]
MNTNKLLSRNAAIASQIILPVSVLILVGVAAWGHNRYVAQDFMPLSEGEFAASIVALYAFAYSIQSFARSVVTFRLMRLQLDELQRQGDVARERRDLAVASLQWAQQHPGGDVHLTLWGGATQ